MTSAPKRRCRRARGPQRPEARRPALVLKTSSEGGWHVWLPCSYSLGEKERNRAQRWLALRAGAEPAATSGEHLGLLSASRTGSAMVWRFLCAALLRPGHAWDQVSRRQPQPPGLAQFWPGRRPGRDSVMAQFAHLRCGATGKNRHGQLAEDQKPQPVAMNA